LSDAVVQELIQKGLQLHQQDQLAEAELLYEQALTINPQHADGLHLLGMIAFQTGRDEAAVALIRQAIALKSNAPSYHSNLGNVLQSQGQLAAAGACYQRALLLDSKLADVHVNLGNIFREQGDLQSSLICYRRALTLNPDLAEAAAAESMTLLLQGDFAAGWRSFERRWETANYDTPQRRYSLPRWHGEQISSGRLLLWGEQGIGDEIMFAGLVPDVLRTGSRCILDCDARLQPLFVRSFPTIEVVTKFQPQVGPGADVAAHLPTGSLPSLFRTSITAFAATKSPYLIADATNRQQLRTRYYDGRKLVGLAWHTKSAKTGRSRSIALPLLAPLFAVHGARWVSLQYGDHAELQEQMRAADASVLFDPEIDQLADIDSFAAQVAAMDLVITIDNSTAHLAGALGVPTWVLLPFAADWRWLQRREDSPWYPSLRLFRQSEPGDWRSVVDRVKKALAEILLR
jgi:Tfp pilus assembly protein PilF